MRNPITELHFTLHPRTTICSTVLPISMLLTLGLHLYQRLLPLLTHQQQNVWIGLGLALACIATALCAYCVRQHRRGERCRWQLAILQLAALIAILSYVYSELQSIFPSSIPPWAFAIEDWIFLPSALLMPGILHALLILCYRFTAEETSILRSAGICVALPVAWYLLITVVAPLRHPVRVQGIEEVFYLAVLISICCFFICLTQVAVTLFRASVQRYRWLLYIVVGLVLPLLGLHANGSLTFLSDRPWLAPYADFSHPAFFWLTIANGLGLLIPSTERYSALGAAVRTATLPFTVYFFLCFLPVVPLSLVLVAFFGFGLLPLAPILLAGLQLLTLRNDWRVLRRRYRAYQLIAVGSLLFAIIPTTVVASYYSDRQTLLLALNELRQPDYTAETFPEIEIASLTRVLEVVRSNEHRRAFERTSAPLLGSLYRSIVLDGMTLSTSTLRDLVARYELPLTLPPSLPAAPTLPRALLKELTLVSVQGTRSVVHARLEHSGSSTIDEEYVAEFELPPGVFISGLQLQIDGEMVPGDLVEKQAALWIYQQIVSQRRDPALLYYVSANRLRLHVFPVPHSQPRLLELTFLSNVQQQLTIDQQSLVIGQGNDSQIVVAGNMLFATAEAKRNLPLVTRRPFLYFIIDCGGSTAWQAAQIRKVQANLKLELPSKMLLGRRSYPNTESIASELHACVQQGQFDLEYALKAVFARSSIDDTYPIPIVVTESLASARLPEDLSAFLVQFPEVTAIGVLTKSSAEWHSSRDLLKTDPPHLARSVRHWTGSMQQVAYLADSGESSEFPLQNRAEEARNEPFPQALSLRGRWYEQTYFPSLQSAGAYTQMLRSATTLGVLIPGTAYIALETEFQRQELRRRHQLRLEGNLNLDVGGEVRRMDEPGLLWLVLILLLLGRIRLGTRILSAPGVTDRQL